MTSHTETRIVRYSAERMFDVVADVEHYPDFLPWCTGLRVLSRMTEDAREIVMADMSVGFRSLREHYTSRIVMDRDAGAIDVVQTEGPFRQLENHWRFTPMGERCKIEFRIAFEFKSRMLSLVAGSAFGLVQMKMTDAFEARARALSKNAQKQL